MCVCVCGFERYANVANLEWFSFTGRVGMTIRDKYLLIKRVAVLDDLHVFLRGWSKKRENFMVIKDDSETRDGGHVGDWIA